VRTRTHTRLFSTPSDRTGHYNLVNGNSPWPLLNGLHMESVLYSFFQMSHFKLLLLFLIMLNPSIDAELLETSVVSPTETPDNTRILS
jgi:hypothetical protein